MTDLPPHFGDTPFSTAEALAAGVPSSRLRRNDLTRPFRGVRSRVVPSTTVDRCLAYSARLIPGHAFCGWSAARLWGMWLPRRPALDALVHVVAVGDARPPRMTGVRGSHAITADLRIVHDVPATSPASTWWALGSYLSLEELVAAADSLVRRDSPRCTLADLAAAAAAVPGRRGVAACRRALPLVRARCDSAKETELRLLLRAAGLPEPLVNPEVLRTRNGRRFGDLVFAEYRDIAEYDGGQHRTDARQFARDVVRLEELARARWTVIRVLKEHFADPDEVVRRVSDPLLRAGWPG